MNTDDICCYTFANRKECSLSFPRRVFVPWLAGTYICDYLQPSETLEVRTSDLMCKIFSYVVSCNEKEKKKMLRLLNESLDMHIACAWSGQSCIMNFLTTSLMCAKCYNRVHLLIMHIWHNTF